MMYEELVKRLKIAAQWEDKGLRIPPSLCLEAANTIESTNKAYQMISEAYEAEVTKQNWIPVTERLPDNIDEEVLVCNEGYGKDGTGFATVAVYNGNGWLECWERKQYLACITYWMPLPEPPKEEH